LSGCLAQNVLQESVLCQGTTSQVAKKLAYRAIYASFVSGLDFTGCEKLAYRAIYASFVSGLDFSRAENRRKTLGFSPCGTLAKSPLGHI
jgi:hypothetical protein